jgi:hypothetical protein
LAVSTTAADRLSTVVNNNQQQQTTDTWAMARIPAYTVQYLVTRARHEAARRQESSTSSSSPVDPTTTAPPKDTKRRTFWEKVCDPTVAKIIVIDECCTLPTDLLETLFGVLSQIAPRAPLLLTGDLHQLPPIDCTGRIIQELIEHANLQLHTDKIHFTTFTRVHRQRDSASSAELLTVTCDPHDSPRGVSILQSSNRCTVVTAPPSSGGGGGCPGHSIDGLPNLLCPDPQTTPAISWFPVCCATVEGTHRLLRQILIKSYRDVNLSAPNGGGGAVPTKWQIVCFERFTPCGVVAINRLVQEVRHGTGTDGGGAFVCPAHPDMRPGSRGGGGGGTVSLYASDPIIYINAKKPFIVTEDGDTTTTTGTRPRKVRNGSRGVVAWVTLGCMCVCVIPVDIWKWKYMEN